MHSTNTSISQFVLKVHSRCDLACDHCYVYEHRDQSWRGRPFSASSAVIRQAAARIAEHAREHDLASVHVILHGGEPLLLGARRLHEAFEIIYSTIGPVAETDLRIHTNGVRLSAELCEVFARFGVGVGVSLDGDRAANDRHRRFADGRSSHAQARRALELLRLPEYRRLFAGILCTVDLANDPSAVLDALLAEDPPRIDFLLPHATWDNPPQRPQRGRTAYADWLNAVFDRWAALGRPVPVRLFESIESVAVGEASRSEGIGLDPVDLLVIETGGEWEQVDSLKTVYDGAPMLIGPTNEGAPTAVLNVFDHSVDDAAAHPAVAARQNGSAELADTCKACRLVERCGGGHYAHRYRSGSGFRNPSVYCEDLKALITHIGVPQHSATPAATGERRSPGFAHFDLTDVAAIADGPAGADRARRLASTQTEITRAHLVRIGLRAAKRATPMECATDDGWNLLCALDREAPAALQTVLGHPFTQAWVKQCWRRLRHGEPLSPADSSRMSASALAVALTAGVDAALEIRHAGPLIHLPTLGTLVREESADGRPMIEVRAGRIDEATPSAEAWHSSTWIDIGGYILLLEDLDPYRHSYGYAATERLSESALSQWRDVLQASLDLLDRWAPNYAEQVRSCVRSVVPLIADDAGAQRSETSSDAFGAIATALPSSPDALAMLLVHESQHLLLDTVLATHDLYDVSDERTFSVGWREDERPIDGVLQGAFAHVALAEAWKARHVADDGDPAESRALAYRYGAWSRISLDQLISHGALSPLGVTFAQKLIIRIERTLAS
jgi:uncharacterized protein